MLIGKTMDLRAIGRFFNLTATPRAFTLAKGVPTPIPSPIIDSGICSVNSSVGCTPFVQFPYTGYAPRLGTWNATVERRIGSSNLVRLAYEGNAGVHLFASREYLDQANPKYQSLGALLDQPVSSFIGTTQAQAIGFKLPFASFPADLPVVQALSPFPQYYGISENQPARAVKAYQRALEASLPFFSRMIGIGRTFLSGRPRVSPLFSQGFLSPPALLRRHPWPPAQE